MQFGETALVKATWRGWIDICQMLIDAGIDVNAQDIVSCLCCCVQQLLELGMGSEQILQSFITSFKPQLGELLLMTKDAPN